MAFLHPRAQAQIARDEANRKARTQALLDRAEAERKQKELDKLVKEHKQLTAEAAKQRRNDLLTKPYDGDSRLLEYCDTVTDDLYKLKPQDVVELTRFALAQANATLEASGVAPLTDQEKALCVNFCMANDISPLDQDGQGFLSAFHILKQEGVIRPEKVETVLPKLVQPEPVVEPEQKNPHPYSSHPQSEYARWDRRKMQEDAVTELAGQFATAVAGITINGLPLPKPAQEELWAAIRETRMPITTASLKQIAMSKWGAGIDLSEGESEAVKLETLSRSSKTADEFAQAATGSNPRMNAPAPRVFA
jgi:hypothetical protein